MGLAVLALADSGGFAAPVLLVFNPSESAPIGWYLVDSLTRAEVGDYVLATMPSEAAALAELRGYLPRNVPLLKQVAAIGGATVCAVGPQIYVNGMPLTVALPRDREGRPLHAWRGCRTLVCGELFLLNTANPASFDSRYFGPISVANAHGVARPLWTWSPR
jgi:conjugative transfer signal peptidase TraF